MKRPNKLDWMIYRIFRWWWNPILQNNTKLAWSISKGIDEWLLHAKIGEEP